MSSVTDIPDDFKPLSHTHGFNVHLQPLYIRTQTSAIQIGMQLTEQHLNRMNTCHGGVYMSLMDFAASIQVCQRLGRVVATPTINFSLDFLYTAVLGEFIWCDIEILRATRNFMFTRGDLLSHDKRLASAHATFKIPSQLDSVPGISFSQFVNNGLSHALR